MIISKLKTYLIEECVIKTVLDPPARDPIWKWFDEEGPIIRAKGQVVERGKYILFMFRDVGFYIHRDLVEEIEE